MSCCAARLLAGATRRITRVMRARRVGRRSRTFTISWLRHDRSTYRLRRPGVLSDRMSRCAARGDLVPVPRTRNGQGRPRRGTAQDAWVCPTPPAESSQDGQQKAPEIAHSGALLYGFAGVPVHPLMSRHPDINTPRRHPSILLSSTGKLAVRSGNQVHSFALATIPLGAMIGPDVEELGVRINRSPLHLHPAGRCPIRLRATIR